MTSQMLGGLFAILLVSCAARFIHRTTLRQLLLLAASYFFYAAWAGKRAVIVLIASSLLNYLWGSRLRKRPTTPLLWIGIALNVLLLGSFKYLLPVADQWSSASWEADILQQIIVPIGISFWTFQGLSYLFELYREEELDPTFIEFFLYMAFWPTVLSGPVCRLPNMLPQFRRRPTGFVGEDFSLGTIRIIQGLFMKLVLAQLLASGLSHDGGVNAGFDEIAPARSALDVWALAIGYGFQLFFDFAGYSNIVIGAARLLGIRVQENFDRPYLSATPSIFWTRWHMSLSFWIRDYVFLPLVTLRRNPWWPYPALLISMVVFGFWHGARLTYVVWGAYHGLLLIGHRLGQRAKKRLRINLPYGVGAVMSWGVTFALVSLGYIVFRANDLSQALHLLRAVIAPHSYAFAYATLPRDYYFLVGLIALGYFLYVGVAELLVLWKTHYRESLRNLVKALPAGTPLDRSVLTRVVLWFDGLAAEYQGWLVAPAFVLLLMVTGLSFFGQSSNIAPFIYTLF
jgi:alginate O-acetyltransferase complex protein AlgI